MVNLKEIDRELAEILLDNVINKRGNLSYTEVAEELSTRLGREINPHLGLTHTLDNVSTLCFELGLPLLSARVTKKDITDVKATGDGFISMAISFRPEYKNMNSIAAWKQELNLTRECPNWHRLREYLDGVPIDTILSRKSTAAPSEDHINEASQSEELPQTSETHISIADPVFPDEVDVPKGIKEGAVRSINVNVHERNPAARQKCIEYHGTRCTVCNVDLGDIYGENFSTKIHVHHLNPISEYDEQHEINPIQDLRPICPNCHMIIHCGKGKPYSIVKVREMMVKKRH